MAERCGRTRGGSYREGDQLEIRDVGQKVRARQPIRALQGITLASRAHQPWKSSFLLSIGRTSDSLRFCLALGARSPQSSTIMAAKLCLQKLQYTLAQTGPKADLCIAHWIWQRSTVQLSQADYLMMEFLTMTAGVYGPGPREIFQKGVVAWWQQGTSGFRLSL